MTSTFSTTKARLSSDPPTSTSPVPPPLPVKHWSQTCHDTILSSNDSQRSLQLSLAGGAENGRFIYLNESVSILRSKPLLTIVKGSKIDADELVLEIDRQSIAGCTLADVELLVERFSSAGKQIQLKTIKSGLTKDLRQFLDGRFEKDSIDHKLQQTIRDNLYMRTVPCTTRPPRPGEINGQDYTFLSIKDFRALEKSGNLLESGVYQGHYYGTPRPLKESAMLANHVVRRSNSANEMFQNNDGYASHRSAPNGNTLGHLSGELISCLLKKSGQGFGFTIIGGKDKGETFLQVKDILPDGPAARDGKLQRGDILLEINDLHVLGYSHTDVVKMFQALNIGDTIQLTVCRGYPLTVNLDDPQIDLVSLNGVHHLPNGKDHSSAAAAAETLPRWQTIKIRKGTHGFGFTIADSPSGQRIKSIVDKQRCQNLCEGDLLLSINGEDLAGKQHGEVVEILIHCLKEAETVFVIRRGDADMNNNSLPSNGNHYHAERNAQENGRSYTNYSQPKPTEQVRSKTPTPYTTTPMIETLPSRSRTPLPNAHPQMNTSTSTNMDPPPAPPVTSGGFVPDSVYTFDRQAGFSRSARDIRSTQTPLSRSKTPGPEFESTYSSSSYRAAAPQPRSKTPTAVDYSSSSLHNSRSLQSVHPHYSELVVNLTLLRPNDGFGLRILGGEEEKSQVSIGRIVPHSPADVDGRLRAGDEIIKIDGHSTIRDTHNRVVQLMQQARENQHVSLVVRRHFSSNRNPSSYVANPPPTSTYHQPEVRPKSALDNDVRYVTLHKSNENQSFGFVIISSQQRAGAVVGTIIPNSPADQCGQLYINDRIIAVNNIDLTHMLHTDVVNLIKESGRTITLKIVPSEHQEHDRLNGVRNPSYAVRPSSSSPPTANIPNPTQQSIRNAYSQNPLALPERTLQRPPPRSRSASKSSSSNDGYFLVELQRLSNNSSFGFSIRGGREFSIPLFILKVADHGLADEDGQMQSGDQIIEINGRSTYGMMHGEAIALIRAGGLHVRLLLRKTNAPPPSLDEVKMAMEQGADSLPSPR